MTFAAVALLLLGAARDPHAGEGSVSYVTAKDAYLDVGKNNGLNLGAQVKITRRNRAIGTCEVVEVATDTARCKSDRAALGDHIAFTSTPAPPAPERVRGAFISKDLEPLKGDAEIAALRTVVENAPLEKVAHKKDPDAFEISTRANAALREQVWVLSAAPEGGFARTSLDAAVHTRMSAAGFPLYANGDVRITGDLIAPATQRTRAGEPVEIYVWDASVGLNGDTVVAQLGRFLPRKAPGVVLLDGVQAGARFGEAEVGVYAGSIPDLLTIYPTFADVTGGVYGGIDLEPTAGLLVNPRARIAVVTSPDGKQQRAEVEAETAVSWLGVGGAGVDARVVSAQADGVIPTLDAFRIDGEVDVLAPVKINAGYRYLGTPELDFDFEGALIGPVETSHHASASASYEVIEGIIVGLDSGLSYDVGQKLLRTWIGPQLGLPDAFGSWGGFEVGYLEQLGDTAGRSAYVGTRLNPLPMLNVVTRVSYFEENALGDAYREAGLMNLVNAPVLPWLSVQGRLYLQQGLPELHGAARAAPSLLMADLGVTGSL